MDVTINAHNQREFLEQFPLGSFLQSQFWQRFLTLQGKKAWQLNVYDRNHLVAHCLIYSNNLPLGKSYLYSAKGPLMLPTLNEDERKEAFELILSQIRDITIATRRREEVFCRLEPNVTPPSLLNITVKPSIAIQPSTTTYLELNQPAEELMATFKEKTRYNIRLAEKKGITVHWSQEKDALKKFLTLITKTAHRHRIRMHESTYYNLLLKAGREFNTVTINWAEYQGKAIAANLYIMQYPTMTYLHGGFDYKYRNLMAPYLLQWEAIKLAISQDMQFYDFWGFAPSDGSKPSWAGFSRFKEGFNGKVVTTPGCYEFIYNPMWYQIYERFKQVRSIIKI